MTTPSDNSSSSILSFAITAINFNLMAISALGGFFGAINDALDFVTWPITWIGTVLVFVLWGVLFWWLRWMLQHVDNPLLHQQKRFLPFPFIGFLILLWLPVVWPTTPPQNPTDIKDVQIVQTKPVQVVIIETPTPQSIPILTPTNTPLPFQPAEEGETLIIIADFYRADGITDARVNKKIADVIRTQSNDNSIRIELEPTQLRSGDREGARELGRKYNADLIIWGEEDTVSMEANFLNLNRPLFVASDVSLQNPEGVYYLSGLQDPDSYYKFISNDLPKQLGFLSFFAIAQLYQALGDYDSSLALINDAIMQLEMLSVDQFPDGSSDAYFLQGYHYTANDRHQEAINSYGKAIEIDSQHAYAYHDCGGIQWSLGRMEEAVTNYDKAIESDSKFALAYFSRAIAKHSLGQYEDAISDFNNAIELNGQLVVWDTNKRVPQYFIEEYQDKGWYENTVDVVDYTGQEYGYRGHAKHHLEQYEDAISDYDKAIEFGFYPLYMYVIRGLAKSTLGQENEAIVDYMKAIELDPEQAYYYRALVRYQFGQYEESIVDYDEAIKLEPDSANLYYLRANAKDISGLYESALDDYNQAISLGFEPSYVFYYRANAKHDLKDYEGAIDDYSRSIELDSDYVAAYHDRGLSKQAMGDEDGAQKDFEKAEGLRNKSDLDLSLEFNC